MLACPQSRLGLGLDWTDFERRKSVKMLFDLPKNTLLLLLIIIM